MRTRLLTIGALAISGALTLNAQQPQRPPNPQGDTTQRAAEAAKAQVVTVTACHKAEKHVPARRPNAPETAAAGRPGTGGRAARAGPPARAHLAPAVFGTGLRPGKP